MKHLPIGLSAIACVLLLWGLNYVLTTPSHESAEVRATSSLNTAPSRPKGESAPRFQGTIEQQSQGTSRAAVEVDATLSGLVTNLSGTALPDATISFSPTHQLRSFSPLSAGTWIEQMATMLFAQSDAQGHFEFDFPSGRDEGILWVSKPGYEGRFVDINAGGLRGTNGLPVTIALGLADEVAVVVNRTDGFALGAFSIVERGVGDRRSKIQDATPADRAASLFLRVAQENQDGSVWTGVMPSIPGQVWFHAEAGELTSNQVLRVPGEVVELSLHPSFTLAVHLEKQALGTSSSGPTVTVFTLGASEYSESILTLNEHGDGQAKIPLADCPSYGLQVVGGGFAIQTKSIPTPGPGAFVEVRFSGEPVEDISLHFEDQGGAAVEGVESQISYTSPEGEQNESGLISASDEDGDAVLHSMPVGPFWVMYNHPDFSDGFSGPHYRDDMAGKKTTIRLDALGSITGYVLAETRRLTEYKLFAWSATDSPESALELDLSDSRRKDGQFSIKLPLGEFNLMAWGPGFSNGPATSVSITREAVTELELSVSQSISGSGRLLDEVTYQPIVGAKVWPSLSSAGSVVAFVEDAGISDSNGHFTVRGFSPNELANLAIEAPGYASASFLRGPTLNGGFATVDFEDLVLTRESHLDVRFSTGNDSDWSGHFVEIFGCSSTTPVLYLNEDGGARFEGVTAGRPTIRLYSPLGLPVWVQTQAITGSGPWELAFDLQDGHSVEVHVPNVETYGLGKLYVSVMSAENSSTARSRYMPLDPDTGVCLFEGIPAGTHSVFLLGPALERLACERVTVLADQITQVSIEPGDLNLSVSLTDSQGQPMAQVEISASPPGEAGASIYSSYTDQEGLADLGMVPFQNGFLTIVDNATDSCMSHVPFSIAGDPSPISVTWDAPIAFAIRIADRGQPIVGAQVTIDLVEEPNLLFYGSSGSQGEVHFGQVSDTQYAVSSSSSWLWPEVKIIRPTHTGPVDVEFRRRGDLRLQLRTVTGEGLAGVPVELGSVEFSTESVATWFAGGFVKTGAGGLQTDHMGELSVTGLPNGKFTWDAPSVGLSGVIVVPPLGVGEGLGILEQ